MKKKGCLLLSLIIAVSAILSGCKDKDPVSKTDIVLDTVASITLYDSPENSEEILEDVFDMIKDYEGKFSAYEEDSEIYRINHAHGEAVEVSKQTLELIEKGIYYSNLSGGKFDITSGALNELWHITDNDGYIPSGDEIKMALDTIDYRKVSINKEKATVKLENPTAHIDLGAIAKGYIGGEIKEYLISKGVKSALINLGGNVVLIGGKNGGDFTIGIPKPFKIDEIAHTVFEKDKSIVTSGNYQRYFEKDGQIYHHIMDLETGYPVESGISSVTIVCKDATAADALSTISYILGEKEGKKFLQEYDSSIESYWIE